MRKGNPRSLSAKALRRAMGQAMDVLSEGRRKREEALLDKLCSEKAPAETYKEFKKWCNEHGYPDRPLLPPQPDSLEPLACDHCGRPHPILHAAVEYRAATLFRCWWCDHTWEVADEELEGAPR